MGVFYDTKGHVPGNGINKCFLHTAAVRGLAAHRLRLFQGRGRWLCWPDPMSLEVSEVRLIGDTHHE